MTRSSGSLTMTGPRFESTIAPWWQGIQSRGLELVMARKSSAKHDPTRMKGAAARKPVNDSALVRQPKAVRTSAEPNGRRKPVASTAQPMAGPARDLADVAAAGREADPTTQPPSPDQVRPRRESRFEGDDLQQNPPRLIQSIVVPGQSPYPLRHPISLRIVENRAGVMIRSPDLGLDKDLVGRGRDWESALDDFAGRFDLLVQRNWFVPPHVMTEKQQRIASILDRLVDWKRYEEENPLVQPMWGRIRARRADGSLRIRWVIGPHEDSDKETLLPQRDVPSSLGEMEVGQWFYGTAKCYLDHVEWVEEPEVVPDPHDLEARRAVWESLPKVRADQPGCWPMKKL
jgi:hypothetical protein